MSSSAWLKKWLQYPLSKMVMEAKCCEHAMAVVKGEEAKAVVTALKPLLAGLLPETRKLFVKELVKLGPQYAELVDLL